MKRPRTSRQRYDIFRKAYQEHRTDDLVVTDDVKDKPQPVAKEDRRRYLASYVKWLRPHAGALAVLLLLAALAAGLDMLPPLFLRYVVDRVLLVSNLSAIQRLGSLHAVGGLFLAVIVFGRLVDALRSYRQRQLNA